MKKITRYFFVLIFFSLFSFHETSAELLKPNNEFKPFDVVKIQLSALKNNNKLYENAGIEQTWKFFHPSNKNFTGNAINISSSVVSLTVCRSPHPQSNAPWLE